MYPSEFAYHRPGSLGEALSLLQSNGDGDVKVLAGGQSLLPLIKLRLAQPSALVDMARVPQMRGIVEEGDGILLGAMTTYFQAIASPLVQQRCPLIVQALRQVGDPQVRARGTIGGSLAHADPAGDLPAGAAGPAAQIRAICPTRPPALPPTDFFLGTLTTSLPPHESVTPVEFPAPGLPRTRTAN